MTDSTLDLSLLDPNNLDFSELPRYPKSLQIVNNEAIVTYSDGTEDNLGMATLPAANTIESAEVDASGRLVVNYFGGGSADVGKVKGVRNVPLTVSGQGVLTSRIGNALTFTPIPFDNTTVRIRDGVMVPSSQTLRADQYCHALEISLLADNGFRPITSVPYLRSLNHLSTNKIGATLEGGWVNLEPGFYFAIACSSLRRRHTTLTRFLIREPDGAVTVNPLLEASGVSSNASLADGTTTNRGVIQILEGQKLGVGNILSDSRAQALTNAGGIGPLITEAFHYNVYAQLRIWKL